MGQQDRGAGTMTKQPDPVAPAFYAAPRLARGRLADWWVLLHPPYTLWHLSYVVIGAAIAPEFDGLRLLVTIVAFFLAVGLAAHALDELQDRPLRTRIPDAHLIGVAIVSLGGAVALGLWGVSRLGPGLLAFIVVGVLLTVGYNLELFGGRLHNDLTFALGWGGFPVLTAYYAQAERLALAAFVAAGFACWLSAAQRALSTQARALRRRVDTVEGTITYLDGGTQEVTRGVLLTPIEVALRALVWSVATLAVTLVLVRTIG